jgi:protein TonB
MKNERDRDRGIQNAYFAKVEKALQNWPSQSEFAGQTVKVWLRINRDGSFQFRLLSASNNEDFNSGLIQYLRQLQRVGFDPHRNSKPYELNVEFVAKE